MNLTLILNFLCITFQYIKMYVPHGEISTKLCKHATYDPVTNAVGGKKLLWVGG